MNLAYSVAVEYMDKDERKEFDSSLSMTMLEWTLAHAIEQKKDKESRKMLAQSFGEVG